MARERGGQGDPLAAAVRAVLAARSRLAPSRALLVALSGIDGAGKGWIGRRLEARLEERGAGVAAVSVDDWLELPSRRFDPARPAAHFYESGIRFGELYERLLLPLARRREVRLEAEVADATGRETYRRRVYDLRDVDVVLVEGIFLLKRELRGHHDLSLWVDCSFETALERGLARGQEGLPPEEARRDFERVYFPAQRLHFARDAPRGAADLRLPNDPRLARGAPPAGA